MGPSIALGINAACYCDCFRNDDNADADAIDSIDPAIDAMDNAAKMKMMKSQLKNWKARGIRKTFVTCLICYNQYGMIRSLENHIKAHGNSRQLALVRSVKDSNRSTIN